MQAIDEDGGGWDNDADTTLPDNCIPRPLYWRVLVMPVRAKRVSAGGILLPAQTQDNQEWLNYVGRLVAVGKLAFTVKRLDGEDFPKVGDWVLYGRHAGQKISVQHPKDKDLQVKLILCNDDELLGVATDPSVFKIYV